MRIEHVATRTPIEYVELVVFDPWPFVDHDLLMADHIGYISEDGILHKGGSWMLGRGDNRLCRLSDDTWVVLAEDVDLNEPIFDRRFVS